MEAQQTGNREDKFSVGPLVDEVDIGRGGKGMTGRKTVERSEEKKKPPNLERHEPGRQNETRPWSCAKVNFNVLPPKSNSKGRGKELRKLKEVADRGLSNTPYVTARWADGKETAALLDTGAQWSLITEAGITSEERETLAGLNNQGISGRGVSGEKISVIGEVWRDVWIGEMLFDKHRFVVVEQMICDTILGIDFWSRAPTMAFDFNHNEMIIGNHRIKLHQHPKMAQEESGECEAHLVAVAEQCTIPGRSVALIKCTAKGLDKRKEYMIEPLFQDDSLVSTPYGMIGGDENLCLRIANLGEDSAEFSRGQMIATAQQGEWVRNVKPEMGRTKKGSQQKPRKIDFDSMLGQDLDPKKRTHLLDILGRYSDVFYQGGELPIVQMGIEHTVEVVEGKAPAVFKPRRLSRETELEVKEHVQELLKTGVIRQSNSVWAAPIVCARKRDGSLRMAIDYRALNSVSHTATLHPIPLIDDLLDRLAKAKYFAVLDAKSGYHQLPLKEEDSKKTAFVVPWGHYEFAERTPFGLKGAGYSFQRMMSTILGASNFEDALCYLDDVLIWGETWDVFMKRLRKVLDKIRSAGLALGPKKCKVGVQEVSYLGYTIKEGMVKISEQRVAQIRQIERPRNVRELRSALGAFAYVQRWIPGLAEIAKPLYNGLSDKPYARLDWTSEMDEGFETIKQMVADAVALSLPHMEKRFTLVTDCSKEAAGAMLSQVDERNSGKLKPVAFFHHTLSKSEQNFSATERELLAIVIGVKKFRVYLGKGFDLITDHQALQWLKSLDPDNETGRRGRWLDFLQQFDMTVTPKRGKSPEMRIADFLSRVRCNGEVKDVLGCEGEILALTGDNESEGILISKKEILEAQARCPVIQPVKQAITKRIDLNPGNADADSWRIPSFTDNPGVKELWKMKDRLILDGEGLLRLKFNGGKRTKAHPFGTKVKNRIVIPATYKDQILSLVHRSATAAHMGSRRTWQRARNNFWWPKMRQDIEKFVGECDECGRNKHENHPNTAPRDKTSIPGQPLEEVMIDFVGSFQPAKSHLFRYILQIQDVFSRFIIFIPCMDSLAITAVEALMDHWIAIFGVPERLRSDRGKHFVAEIFEGICAKTGIKHKLGSPEHPQSQAQVERHNQLVNQLRCLCDNDIEGWPAAVKKVQCSHNAATNATTGFSPAKLLLGQEFKLPEDLIANEENNEPTTVHVEERDDERQAVVAEARRNIDGEQEKQVEEAGLGVPSRNDPYKLGDLVRYKLNVDVRNRLGGKISQRYSQPYVVTEVKENGYTYVLKPSDPESRGRIKTRHYNLLKTVERVSLDEETPQFTNNNSTRNSRVS